jgi:tRNA(Ile2) C34 agmatinyltransferase TiaS
MPSVIDPAAVATRCPGCGNRAIAAVTDTAADRCPRCDTSLVVSARRLDVEHAVRERLYGRRSTSVDVTRRPRT